MLEPKGFLKVQRQDVKRRPVQQRIHDFEELELPLTPEDIRRQTARCMNCGIPFCHGFGCPLANRIPEFNEFLYHGQWQKACDNLHSTNNFPEITGRVCPAPCESACTLGINDEPVLIKHIELQIVERGFEEGWIQPLQPREKTSKKIAINWCVICLGILMIICAPIKEPITEKIAAIKPTLKSTFLPK